MDAESQTLWYDLNGNLTAMPEISGVQWDVFDRMTRGGRVELGTVRVSHKMNAAATRVADAGGVVSR